MEILASTPSGVPVAVRCVADEIGLVRLLDEALPWDDRQCKFSPGTRLLVLIFAILYDRTALYRVQQFLAYQDLPLLVGRPAVPEDFNDDALARALDKLWQAGAQRVFTTVCARSMGTFGLDWPKLVAIHGDTTSISVYGAYPEDEPGAIRIRHGYSKDKRPDLKQFGIGLLATREGVPCLASVHSGNLEDKKWNHGLLDRLAKELPAELLQRLLYVTDSALVTYENLRKLEDLGIRFLSRLPETFGVAQVLKTRAWAEGGWQDIGRLSEVLGAASYQVWETVCELDGRTYRALVVYSTSLDKRKEQALKRQEEREREELEQAVRRLHEQRFACQADAEGALRRLQEEAKAQFWAVQGQVVAEQERVKRPGPGRPRKGEEPEYQTVYRVQAELVVQEGKREAARRLASTFVLLTNTPEPSARDLLAEYKGQQTAVEIPFRVLKGLPVSPVFVKKPHRVEALAWVILMAYLIYALMQYRVRQAIAHRGKPLCSPVRKKDMRPTGRSILDMLLMIQTVKVRLPDGTVARYVTCPTEHIEDLLNLLRIGKEAYTTVPYT